VKSCEADDSAAADLPLSVAVAESVENKMDVAKCMVDLKPLSSEVSEDTAVPACVNTSTVSSTSTCPEIKTDIKNTLLSSVSQAALDPVKLVISKQDESSKIAVATVGEVKTAVQDDNEMKTVINSTVNLIHSNLPLTSCEISTAPTNQTCATVPSTISPFKPVCESSLPRFAAVPPSRLPPASALLAPLLNQLVPRLGLAAAMKNVESLTAASPRWSYPLNGGTWVALPASYPSVITPSVSTGMLSPCHAFPLVATTPFVSQTPPTIRPDAPRQTVLCSSPNLIESIRPGSVDVGINSPIKQFLDRTRVHTSTIQQPLTFAEDGPTDLSMKTLRRMEHESNTNTVAMRQSTMLDSDGPLDLCMKSTTTPKTADGHFPPRTPTSLSLARAQHSTTPILTVPLCFPSGHGDLASLNGSTTPQLVIPTPQLFDPNSPKLLLPPLAKSDIPRTAFTMPNVPLSMQMSYPPSSFAIVHPAFQMSAASSSSATASSLPVSPSPPVVATLSPFLCSSFLMTRFAAAHPVVASLNDGRLASGQK
jgi:hypothetical protein